MEDGILLDWLRDYLGQGVVIQCVQYRVGFLGSRGIRWQNIFSNRSLKDLSDAVPELCWGHTCLDVPHRMVHVNEDSADPILVGLNIRLASIPSVCDVEGKN